MTEERKSRYELFLEEEARKAQPTKQRTSNYKRKYKSREDQFWKMFHTRTRKEGECLIWTGWHGGKNGNLPRCSWKGTRVNTRRVVYQLSLGDVPDKMFVLTTCHTPRCVRISHLILADHEEYAIARDNFHVVGEKHGTHTCPDSVPRGEAHWCVKLDESKVRAIRDMYIPYEMSYAMIAAKFGVHPTLITQIVKRKVWAHVE